ncbi:hypothetical protein [Streptomyces niger]|uniref:hypothetical protein n=1 Tax=Streptomyces niger TaxID=66373 RepID=UPI00069C9A9E|nr:hypothetical protein [Streptomyces niger]
MNPLASNVDHSDIRCAIARNVSGSGPSEADVTTALGQLSRRGAKACDHDVMARAMHSDATVQCDWRAFDRPTSISGFSQHMDQGSACLLGGVRWP